MSIPNLRYERERNAFAPFYSRVAVHNLQLKKLSCDAGWG